MKIKPILDFRKLETAIILMLFLSNAIFPQQLETLGTGPDVNTINNPSDLFDADSGTFTDDRDMHVYKWVKIGIQIWMAENLAYLPLVVPASVASNYEVSYCYVYDNQGISIGTARNTYNYAIYGVLYNWRAAMDGAEGSIENPSGIQGVCPSGWHMPSDEEWTELIGYLGGYKLAGMKLKKEGASYWKKQDDETTNESGFSALPGGYLGTGFYTGIGYTGCWWSATSYAPSRAWGISLSSKGSRVTRSNNYKEYGYSVRCVKDQ